MAADWEEVKKLAFDFQRTQQMSSVQKLSERNCVDIVKRLIEMKLIDVIFTNDGKEYLTNDHLTREIENELYAAGGRIGISDLVGILNVDYGHIEVKANQLVRQSSGDVSIVLEQLISREYKDNLSTEIDLQLQEVGTLAISDLAKHYDLPADFLNTMIEERMGSIIKGKFDKWARILYTFDYFARYESKVLGVFSAITRPVTLQTIVNRYGISEKIVNVTLEDLISKKRIQGTISGTTYIPEIYSKNQSEYVTNFYKHNRYLDYSTLAKLGISNGENYLQKRFGNELCYLDSCAVDRLLTFQIETMVEDCIQQSVYVDLMEIMPSVLNSNDIDQLIRKTLGQNKTFNDNSIVLCETIVVSNGFVEKAKNYFNYIKMKRAEEDLKNGILLQHFSKSKTTSNTKTDTLIDDRKSTKEVGASNSGKKNKKGGGGSGNSQGREVKNKAVKKKYKSGKGHHEDNQDEDVEKSQLHFLDLNQIIKILNESLSKNKSLDEEVPEMLVESLAQHISDELQKSYETYSMELFVNHNAEIGKAKKSFSEVQQLVNKTYGQILMFEKGIQVFITEDIKSKLVKHLQKTLCTDIVHLLLEYFSEQDVNQNMTHESRVKLISKLEPEIKESLMKVNNSLTMNLIEDFVNALEEGSPKLDIMLKKIDKKREKTVLSEHRQLLLIQLSECSDPILGLHISVLLTFQTIHEAMVHATGKFVPQILFYLEKDLDNDLYQTFKESQDLVLQFVSTKDETIKTELLGKMSEQFNSYRPKVIEFKKKTQT